MDQVLIIVEDVGQQELVARILGYSNFQRVLESHDLSGGWASRLVPKSFPMPGRRLTAPHPVPLFLKRCEAVVAAILVADGNGGSVQQLVDTAVLIGPSLSGCAIVVDADFQETPKVLYSAMKSKLEQDLNWAGRLPSIPGLINLAGNLRSGIYILPDNESSGTLETFLLLPVQKRLPQLHNHASQYIGTAIADSTLADDKLVRNRSLLERPSIAAKAVVDVIAAVLVPGKDPAYAVKKQQWLQRDDLQLAQFARLPDFLIGLFDPISPY